MTNEPTQSSDHDQSTNADKQEPTPPPHPPPPGVATEQLKATELAVVALNASIQRLGATSSALKATSLTVLGAMLSFLLSKHETQYIWAALLVVGTFAYLDARYLATERQLLESMRALLLSMAAKTLTPELVAVRPERVGARQTAGALLSWPTFPVYGLQILAVIGAVCFGNSLDFAGATLSTGGSAPAPLAGSRNRAADSSPQANMLVDRVALRDQSLSDHRAAKASPDSGTEPNHGTVAGPRSE